MGTSHLRAKMRAKLQRGQITETRYPHGDEYVLASGTYLDLVATNSDEVCHITEEEALRQTYICAPSFEAFLYRFWMENMIWFNLVEREPLTEEQRQYLAN
jgi:hypothetical protein